MFTMDRANPPSPPQVRSVVRRIYSLHHLRSRLIKIYYTDPRAHRAHHRAQAGPMLEERRRKEETTLLSITTHPCRPRNFYHKHDGALQCASHPTSESYFFSLSTSHTHNTLHFTRVVFRNANTQKQT